MLDPNGIYFAYLRKSREDRDAEMHGEGETLARHERKLQDLAAHLNITITKWYREVVSGETIAARPQMLEMLNDIETTSPDGVLVVEIERLARGDTKDQGLIMETFKYSNTKIITPFKTYDPTNEFDEEYAEFGLFMSRREYKTINRRLQSGRRASFNEGKWTGNKAPYGYERIKLTTEKGFTLQPIPSEAAIVRLIFHLYLYGSPETGNLPIGTTAICRVLDNLHIPPPQADTWQDYTIRSIIDNPAYIGKVRSGKRNQKKQTVNGVVKISRPVNHQCQLKDGLHEAIIDPDIFQKAQEKRKENYKKPFFQTIKNPLAGLIYCAECGKSMPRRPAGSRCPADMIHCSTRSCPTSGSYFALIEQRLITALESWLEQYKISVHDVDDETQKKLLDFKKSHLETLCSELSTLQGQLSKIMDLLERDIYTVEMFQLRATGLNEKIALTKKDISDTEATIRDIQLTSSQKVEVVSRFEHVLDSYWKINDPAIKNALLKEVLVKIIYSKPHKGHRLTGGMDNFTLELFPRL